MHKSIFQFNAEYGARCLRALLRQLYKMLSRTPQEMYKFRTYAFFKLVLDLFPADDRFHPVTTPALIFMCHLISTARVYGIKDAARALMLLMMINACVKKDKR